MGSQRGLPDARLVTFTKLFDDGQGYYIPDYQRPYDWGADHRADLLSDLDKLERLTKDDPDAFHFCGTVICTPGERSHDSFAIVDGQQRLTTLALLHARLCRALEKQTFISRVGSVRFKPQSQDADTFTAILDGRSPGEQKTKAQTNYLAAAEQIDEWIERDADLAARRLELLERHLRFILFVLPDENEVAKVFEAINNRGKPLTRMDLVKNHLIYVTTVNKWETPNINEVWREIQQLAGETRFSDADIDIILRSTVTAQFKPGRRERGETDSKIVARELPAESVDHETFQLFVHFLRENFRTYRNLRNARSTDPKDPAMRAMTHLNHHDSITGVLPLIFARQFLHKGDRSDAPVLTAIEKTNFRLYGLPDRAARSDSYNVRLHKLAHEYFRGEISDQTLIGHLTNLVSSEQKDGLRAIVRSLTLDDDEGYDFYKWPWSRYFLARFEESLLDRQSFDFGRLSTEYAKSSRTNDYLSVEHIWPQNAPDHTVGDYRDRQQIRRLGNLMLLPHGLNITLSNNTPEVKQKKMGDAKITMLRQNRTLSDTVAEAEKFVAILQDRGDARFGPPRSRFNAPTIKRNGAVALIKTVCDLREQAMLAFALEEWRLPGEIGSEREFAGMFSFAHSDEAFYSDREAASNKANENYVIVSENAAESPAATRLRARNELVEIGFNPVRWA